ncbi:MAG: AsmA family protein [Kiloniellaceae bacterium]
MRAIAKIVLWGLAALAALTVLGGVALAFLDWNLLRNTVTDRASAASGRDVRIAGDLDVDIFSWTPEVTAHDVSLGNPHWASGEDMVFVDDLYLRVRLLPILLGRLEVEEMRLAGTEIRLQRGAEGANWELGDSAAEAAVEAAAPDEREDFPVLKKLDVEDARIVFRDRDLQDPIEVELARLSVEADGFDAPVSLSADGSYQGRPLALKAEGESFARFRDGGRPYALKLDASIGETRLAADGTLEEPVRLAGIDAQVDLQGNSLEELYRLFALPLPETPAYALSGRLLREGERWALQGFEGTLGESDLSGEVAVETAGERPRLIADVTSQSFRTTDLEGFWGGEDPGEAEPAAATPESGEAHVLSDEPLSLPKLRRMDAEVRFHGKALRSGALELEDFSAELRLEDGLLTLKPLELGLAEGRILADLRLDGREEVPQMGGDVRVSGLDIGALMALIGEEEAASGLLHGRFTLDMRGRSLHELGASAEGEGALLMSGGKIDNLLLELIALDLQEAAGQWLTGDDSKVDVLCLAMPTRVSSGRFEPRPWILDTTDALVTIEGYVDLGSETLEIELTPHPKDFSLFNYLTSIEITGDLVRREVTTSPLEAAGKLALKTLAAPVAPLFSGAIQEEAEDLSLPCDQLRRRLDSAMAQNTSAALKDAALETGSGPSAPPDPAEEGEVEVSRVQAALNAAGFDLAVDGILGPNTEDALRAFQERESLEPSGRPTPQTLDRLGLGGDRE